jgi:hypothetical protein
MSITIRQTLQNPGDKGSAYLFNRKIIKDALEIIYSNLNDIERGFGGVKDDKLYLHIKVPSTKYKMKYDVVLEIEFNNGLPLGDCPLRVFSNAPNFQFTYTYVLNESDSIIEALKSKCFKKSLTDAPVVRNPVEKWGFEKSVMVAIMYLKKMGVLDKNRLLKVLENRKVTADMMNTNIASAQQKLNEYNMLKEQEKRQAARNQSNKQSNRDFNWNSEPKPKSNQTRQINKTKQGRLAKLANSASTAPLAKTTKRK